MPAITRSQTDKVLSDSENIPSKNVTPVLNLTPEFMNFVRTTNKMVQDAENYITLKKIKYVCKIYKYINKKLTLQMFLENRIIKPRVLDRLILVFYGKIHDFEKDTIKYNLIAGYEYYLDKLKMELYKFKKTFRPMIQNMKDDDSTDAIYHEYFIKSCELI